MLLKDLEVGVRFVVAPRHERSPVFMVEELRGLALVARGWVPVREVKRAGLACHFFQGDSEVTPCA